MDTTQETSEQDNLGPAEMDISFNYDNQTDEQAIETSHEEMDITNENTHKNTTSKGKAKKSK